MGRPPSHLPPCRLELLVPLALGELLQKLLDPFLVRLHRGQHLPNGAFHENPAHQAVCSAIYFQGREGVHHQPWYMRQ